jgi:hypothetical protein
MLLEDVHASHGKSWLDIRGPESCAATVGAWWSNAITSLAWLSHAGLGKKFWVAAFVNDAVDLDRPVSSGTLSMTSTSLDLLAYNDVNFSKNLMIPTFSTGGSCKAFGGPLLSEGDTRLDKFRRRV